MVEVSVITPAWNAELTIKRSILSALSQSDISIEIIVVDDASTDATGAVVQALDDQRVRYIRLAMNGGPAAARNSAIAVAQGTWIAVLDADDALLPGRLSNLIRIAVSERLDVVTDNMMVVDDEGRKFLFIKEDLDGSVQKTSLADYVSNNRIFRSQPGEGYLKPLFSAGFLRQHALRYDAATRIGEDFLLVADAMALGGQFGRVRSAGYTYRARAGSISHRLSRIDADAMIEADRRFLIRHAARLSTAERLALQAHLQSLQEGASFAAMVESIKARDFAGLARHFWLQPTAVRHFSMPIRSRIERLATWRTVSRIA